MTAFNITLFGLIFTMAQFALAEKPPGAEANKPLLSKATALKPETLELWADYLGHDFCTSNETFEQKSMKAVDEIDHYHRQIVIVGGNDQKPSGAESLVLNTVISIIRVRMTEEKSGYLVGIWKQKSILEEEMQLTQMMLLADGNSCFQLGKTMSDGDKNHLIAILKDEAKVRRGQPHSPNEN